MEASIAFTFADDSTHSLVALGQAHQVLCTDPPSPSTRGMLLHTCQRVEWYAAGNLPAPVAWLANKTRTIGHPEALIRLGQIAAGTRSLILGERFVHGQVLGAARRLAPAHPLSRLTMNALRLAEHARQMFDLYAPVDYSDLPRLLLGCRGDGAPRQLMVIGGGMLARAIAAAPPPGYERVVMMTRGPRKLRRLVEGFGAVTVVRAASAARAIDGWPYDTVIATTNLHPGYRGQVIEAACSPLSHAVLDLCCTPVLAQRPARYRHLYDRDVLATLASANQDMADRAALARQWIAQHAGVRV